MTQVQSSSSAQIESQYQRQRTFFDGGGTSSYKVRRQQLKTLYKLVHENESAILKALDQDFGKPPMEAFATEVGIVLEEINYALQHLERWMQPKRVDTPLLTAFSKSTIYYQPKGVVLIIAPWNYPFQLAMSPLIAALAAGNTAIVKPSELTPNTAILIEELLQKYFAAEWVCVVQGEGASVVPQLINTLHFDHIFFTGSVPVGREIAKLAAPKLIPVTLELGGKSPVIVDETANFKVAAQRIALGKWMNAGQTCVAPDYLLLQEDIADQFLQTLKEVYASFSGGSYLENERYARLVSEKHLKRQEKMLEGAEIVYGGKVDYNTRKMELTMVKVKEADHALLQEEIFGPVLPVLTYKTKEEARDMIRKNPDPLALYLFSTKRNRQKYFVENLRFGGGMINGTLMYLSNPELPFGGIGTSGMGNYHGHQGFLTFSHQKSVMKQPNWFNPSFIYPPHKSWALKLMRWVMR